MNIDILDTITLSDKNEYLVVSKANYQSNTYYYLIDEKNNENIKFCMEKPETSSLIEISDANIIQALLSLFSDAVNNHKYLIDLED